MFVVVVVVCLLWHFSAAYELIVQLMFSHNASTAELGCISANIEKCC